MNYSEKLRDPRWQKKRLKILERDEFKCTSCGDPNTELQVHHDKYNGMPWEAKDESLTTLCKHCHLFFEYKKRELPGVLKVLDIYKTGTADTIYLFVFNRTEVSRSTLVSVFRIEDNDIEYVLGIYEELLVVLTKMLTKT